MTALNENELSSVALHLLALQATAQLCDLARGQRIREAHVDLLRMYGNAMKMQRVRGICAALRNDEKDVVFLSAVMEAFAHNARNVEMSRAVSEEKPVPRCAPTESATTSRSKCARR